jgi:Flp pilus assembly protein TadD
MRMTNAEEYAAGFGFRGVTPWEYLRSQPLVLLHYLQLSFWPNELLLDYGWPVSSTTSSIYLPGLIIVSLLGASLWCLAYRPRIGAVALSAFLILAPSSSIMPIADLCFEHRMYLPLMAVVSLFVLGVQHLLHRQSSSDQALRLAVGSLIAVTVALGFRTSLRNADYADPIRLWEKNVAARPDHARPHLLLAMLYDRADRSADAGREYQAAVTAKPDYFKGLLNLGGWHFRQSDLQKAAACFERAAQVDPKSAAGFAQWGRTLLELGDTAKAQQQLNVALQLDPRDPVALRSLTWLRVTSPTNEDREPQQALALLKQLPADPQNQDVWRLDIRAAAQAESGDFDAAAATAELALNRAREQHRAAALQSQLEQRLDNYRQRKPWRLLPAAAPPD